jgi:hypothetical protein
MTPAQSKGKDPQMEGFSPGCHQSHLRLNNNMNNVINIQNFVRDCLID